MKKLSKLHLHSEQILTDAEMKHITGGDIYGPYEKCNTKAEFRSQCQVNSDCTGEIKGEGTSYYVGTGKCKFGYLNTGDTLERCYCEIIVKTD